MAVLDDMVVTAPNVAPEDLNVADIKLSIARQLWDWYDEQESTVLLSRKFLFLSVHIRVRDLRPLFVHLIGEPS